MTAKTALCVIPTCRIRGRHLPGCGDDNCGGCLPRQATEGNTCDVCDNRTRERLAAIAELADDARAVARGEVRRGDGGNGGKPGSRPPLNDGATDALDAVTNALTTIARDIAETRGLQIVLSGSTPADPLARVCSWLGGQLGWVRHAIDDQGQPFVVGFSEEVADCLGRVRSIVNGRTAGRYAGPCSALIDDPAAPCPVNCACHNGPMYACDEPGGCGSAGCGRRECRQDVISKAGSSAAVCKTCGAVYDVDEQQAWMRHEIEDQLARPVEIAGILLQLGFPVGYSTIAAYAAKGLIAAHGHDDQGRPRYRIGDVLETRINAANKTSRRRLQPPRDTANPVGG